MRIPWLPNVCYLCESATDTPLGVCCDCYQRLPRILHACAMCGIPMPSADAHYCAPCLRQPKPFQRSYIPSLYRFPLDRFIQQLKFQHGLHHLPTLAQLLIDHVRAQGPELPDCLTPVPLHPQRIRQRGFNQSMELSKLLSHAFRIPIAHYGDRVINTTAQTGLPASTRRQNMQRAFVAPNHIQHAHIAIVDDVVTTTSTVCAFARTLRDAGVQRIDVWAIARTTAD